MSLSFGQSMAANMGMSNDPDWIIKIGDSVMDECIQWELSDSEGEQSHLKVVMPNPDFKLNGQFKFGTDMTIRFGYQNEMSPEAYFLVDEMDRGYGKAMTITVIGRDESQKMAGGHNKGNQGKGDDKQQLDKTLTANGLKMSGDTKGANSGGDGPCYNESDYDLAYRWGNGLSAAGEAESAGDGPTSPLAGEKASNIEGAGVTRHDAYTYSTSGDWAGDGKGGERNANRGKTHGGRHSQAMVTGELELRGFPTLRAKQTVNIAGVGVEDSGTWYVQTVVHSMKDKGILTLATVTRGGDGKGGVGGKAPIVMYANIWKKGEMYVGKRQVNSEPQASFTRGSDEHFIDFKVKEKPQPHRAGGEPEKSEAKSKSQGKGKGLLLDKKLLSTSDGKTAESAGTEKA